MSWTRRGDQDMQSPSRRNEKPRVRSDDAARPASRAAAGPGRDCACGRSHRRRSAARRGRDRDSSSARDRRQRAPARSPASSPSWSRSAGWCSRSTRCSSRRARSSRSKVGQDNSIERLIVPTDPDLRQHAGVPEGLRRGRVRRAPGRGATIRSRPPCSSASTRSSGRSRRSRGSRSTRRSRSTAAPRRASRPRPAEAAAFQQFVTGTDLFAQAGARRRRTSSPSRSSSTSTSSDDRLATARRDRQGHRRRRRAARRRCATLRRVGPALRQRLPRRRARARGGKYFALFAVFVVVLNVALYRSVRALRRLPGHARRLPGDLGRLHRAHRRHLHHRLADGADDHPGHGHGDARLPALALRRPARGARRSTSTRSSRSPTSSSPARPRSSRPLVGFAALAVSDIRPVREMGIWVAVGLFLTWIIVFTLFPALPEDPAHARPAQEQADRRRVVRPLHPTGSRAPATAPAGPGGRRARAHGARARVALFGLPGAVDADAAPHRPGRVHQPRTPTSTTTPSASRQMLPGLSITEVWLKGKLGSVSEPEVLTGLAPVPGGARGRSRRRRGGQPHHHPADDPLRRRPGRRVPHRRRRRSSRSPPTSRAWSPREPMLQRFVQAHELAQTPPRGGHPRHRARGLPAARRAHPRSAGTRPVAKTPALKGVRAEDGRPGPAPGQDEPEPGADAGRELRASRWRSSS